MSAEEALATIVQQEMLKAGIWVRLHNEKGEMVHSTYIQPGMNEAIFYAEDVHDEVHYLSIAIEGREIWRGQPTGAPTRIPEGGKLILNDLIQLLRDAEMLDAIKTMQGQVNSLEAKNAHPQTDE